MPFCRHWAHHLDKAVAWGLYENLLREVVLRMKRRWDEPLSRAMARLFACHIREAIVSLQPTVVVPVPMHWRRWLVRGTNSPEILARALGRAVGVRVDRRSVIRHRYTLPQSDLSPSARKINVQGAFRLRKKTAWQGARVVLVDDVLTTGATCGEIAKILKQAGASAVWAAVLARTPPSSSW